jgi:hypothetical protein
MPTKTLDKKTNELRAQLREVIKVPREERMANWCSEVTFAMLNCPDRLKGVIFKCTDNVGCAAHKFVFGVQSSYVSTPAAVNVPICVNLVHFAWTAMI